MIKKILISLLLIIGLIDNSYAIISDDIYSQEVFITDKNLHDVYSVPTGRDLIITRIDASNTTDLEIHDNNNYLITLGGDYTYTNLIVIKDKLQLKQNSTRDRWRTIQGYLLDEGAELPGGGSVDLSKAKYNGDDLISIGIDFLSNERLWQLYVLYFIWFINFYLLWLVIKWGFMTGTIFYKNKFGVKGKN